jgi:hypothetical protein
MTSSLPQALREHLPTGQLKRAFVAERASIDEEARTVKLAFASETPVNRGWFVEVLDLSRKSMRTGRLTAGANLLCDHDTRDVVAVVESVEIGSDKVARAVVRFGRSVRAEEVFRDVIDGIRVNVSVAYTVQNSITLVRLDSGEEIEALAFSMSLDADSWTWRWNATLPGSAWPVSAMTTWQKSTGFAKPSATALLPLPAA